MSDRVARNGGGGGFSWGEVDTLEMMEGSRLGFLTGTGGGWSGDFSPTLSKAEFREGETAFASRVSGGALGFEVDSFNSFSFIRVGLSTPISEADTGFF